MYDSGFLFGLVLLALLVAFPVYVLLRLAALNRAFNELRELLWRSSLGEKGAKAEEAVLPRPISAPPTPVVRPPSVTAPEPSPRPPVPAAPVQPAAAMPAAAAAAGPSPPTPPSPPARPAHPGAPRPDLESILGANWLSKLGVAAIAIAVAFFFKYAFDAGWIGPTARVTVGLITAAVMLGLGQMLLARPTYRAYAQVLASGGIIVLFLSIYAAYSFYNLIGFGVAFAVLAAAALAASALAVANNTEGVALLCIAGAFATPMLIRQAGAGPGDLLRLYAYLAGLNVWSTVLAMYRPWYSLTALSFGATWLLFFGAGRLAGPNYVLVEAFAGLFLFFACYGGFAALRAEPKPVPGMQGVGVAFILVGCLAFAIASALILAGVQALGLPGLVFAGAFVALLLSVMGLALPRLGPPDSAMRQTFGYLAGGALVLLIGISAAAARPVSAAQAPSAFLFGLVSYVAFLAVAVHIRRASGWEGPAIFLACVNAVTHLIVSLHALAPLRVWGVNAAPLWLPLAGCITLGALWLAGRQRREEHYFPVAVMIIAQAFPLCALLTALIAAAPWPAARASALFFGEFLLVSGAWIGLRRFTAVPALRGDLAAALGNAAVFFGLLATAARLQSYQGLVLLCGYAIAMAVYHALVGGVVLRRARDDTVRGFIYLGLALTFLTIAVPLQLKASHITTLTWSVESAVLVWTGLAVADRRVRWYGIVLLSIVAGKALLLDVESPEHFRLLLNPRILSGASVVAASYVSAWLLWRKREAVTADERALPAILSLLANALTLIFVSLDLWDYFGRGEALAGRSAQQLSLSVFWSVYALAAMSVGIWRRIKPVRLFAMGLLYLSIGKVFLFDLRFLEQPYRIVSFFGLGVILLVVSLLYTRFEGHLNEESRDPGGGGGGGGGAARTGGPAAR